MQTKQQQKKFVNSIEIWKDSKYMNKAANNDEEDARRISGNKKLEKKVTPASLQNKNECLPHQIQIKFDTK